MENNIVLETKLVGKIEGDFFVESYQRGYRWGTEEVRRLIEDIYSNGEKNYCLQPIVVKRDNDKFELIDGQQRLTTLFLIYNYMHKVSNGFMPAPKFTMDYKTRDNTKEFLNTMDLSREDENIDFYHLSNAYKTIDEWFSSREKSVLTKFNQYLDDNVNVIWYEVDNSVKSIPLFTRLNIGKIPLTSAELVKAMFLSRDVNEFMSREKQEQISLQWDDIEKKLHNERLWYFLTNNSNKLYQTRIDLILNLYANIPRNNKEKYYTYFAIEEMKKNKSLEQIWNDIMHTFLILDDWFQNHELYHKVGYLIASNSQSLVEIYELSQNKTKNSFISDLNEKIKLSIKSEKNYSEYTYDSSTDQKKISKLLLLFNVESVRQNGEQTQWFPFDKFKINENGRNVWSLEHIHAQQSQGLKNQAEWKEWLELHLKSIETIENSDSELIDEIKSTINNEIITRSNFEQIQEKVWKKLSVDTKYDRNSIANLALLNTADNSALTNSTFDVKRNKIIEMDQHGKYIPFCTKMVFLKYYTESKDNQLHFWGQKDMEAYIKAINSVLKEYLDKNIIDFELEVDNND